MKSDFSRFLHRTLSYSGLTRISRWGKFANLVDLDTPIKSECDSVCAGRSMVEMLGVLAIIGVLSVGAISGYSKAMFKYKLNKYTEQMNTLVNAVARHVHSFDNIQQSGTILTPYFINMGEIPTEMVKSNDNEYLYDIFGQQWQIFIEDGGDIKLSSWLEDGSSFLSSNSPDSLAICQNLVTIAKENHDNISGVLTATEEYTYLILGDKLCATEYANYYKCLKSLTLNDVYTVCAEQTKGGIGAFQFDWER